MKTTFFFLLPSLFSSDDSESFSSVAEKVKRAEDERKQAKLRTDESLAKVNEKLKKMDKDLTQEKEREKEDLAMFEKNRIAEAKQLSLLGDNLKKFTDIRPHDSSVSFIQSKTTLETSGEDGKGDDLGNDDVLIPLRKAAEAAKKFAADVKLQAMKLKAKHASMGSLIENGKDNHDDDFGRTEWNKAREDMKIFNEELQKDRLAMIDEEEVLKRKDLAFFENGGNAKSSFVQGKSDDYHGLTKEEYDNILTPESLLKFKQKFDAKMKQAREIANEKAPFPKISFAEKDDESLASDLSIENYAKEQEQIKKEQMHVDELQKEFTDGMSKLQESTQNLIKRSKEQVQKYHDLKVRADAGKIKLTDKIDIFDGSSSPSFVEETSSSADDVPISEGRKYFRKDTEDKIKEINNRFKEVKNSIEKESEKENKEHEENKKKLIDNLRGRQEADKSFNVLKDKLQTDIEKLNLDLEKGEKMVKKTTRILQEGH